MASITTFRITTLLLFALLLPASHAMAAEIDGELKQWHTVTLTLNGPSASEEDATNPFTDYALTAWFIHPMTTQRFEVPGFFAADGNAAETSAESGNKWQVRFSPALTGEWTYRVELKRKGELVPLDGDAGKFSIAESDKISDDFRHHGHLQYVGERYLRFAGSGKYFLKAGTDSPETLLGYHDFDGTWHDTKNHPIPAPHDPIELPSLDKGLHRFPDHVRDWRDGDPTWKGGKGKGLIGGLNYLADQGVNSIYFLTMNVNGDGRNVWPWIDPWEHDRFDVSKLAQWEIVFEHMQIRGIQMHVVLQETENDHILDNGELGPLRKLYLREMIARFAHHPAIVWNLGEENLQTAAQQQAMADYIRGLDPYNHPIVIHNDHYSPENIKDTFDPHLGKSTLDGTAIQDFQWNDVHFHTKQYVEASRSAGKPWVVCADEMGGAQFGLPTDQDEPDHFNARSKGLWGNLMAGGAGVEWYFGWQNNSPQSDLSAESWRPRESMWKQSKLAIDFFQAYLPFSEMQPADHLPRAYADYCLAKPGDTYCIYLFSGGNTRLDLQKHRGPFSVLWFNPRDGGELQVGSVQTVWGPGQVEIGEPPTDKGRDWVCLVRKAEPVFQAGWRKDKIVVEAEHFESQSNVEKRKWYELKKSGTLPEQQGVGDATTWVRGILSASKPASKGRFIRLLPDTRRIHDDKLIHGENFSPDPGQMAILSYRVHFAKAGRYYVWARAFSTGTEDNGIHVGLDGDWPDHGQRMQCSDPKREWVWGCAQRTEAVHSGVPMEIYLDVPTAGTHTVQFSMREDGFAFDQFLLTQDREYRPTGAEKGESVRPPEAEIKSSQLAARLPAPIKQPMVFPNEQWQKGTPESQGIDSAGMYAALEYIKGHCKADKLTEVMIVRNGVVIHEGRNTTKVHNIWSCSKSFTSTALGLLIADGKCSIDTKAADVIPEYRPLYPEAKLRDFTTMTSGFSAKGRSRWRDENEDWSWTPYDPAEPYFAPGSAYAYWDEAQMTLGRLLTRIGQRKLVDYLDDRVFEPIGMGKVEWGTEGEIDGIPICNGCTNVKLNARQLARFGHLYLNRGNWNGKQVIPAEWVAAATQNQVPVHIPVGDTDRNNVRGPGAYGFNWWTNGGENRMPDAPPKTYYASGLNHNLLFVIPEWNMVVVHMGVDGNPPMGKPQAWNGFFEKLGRAFLPVSKKEVASTDAADLGLLLKMDFEGDLLDGSRIGHSAEVLHEKGIGPRYVEGRFGKAIRFYNKDNKPGGEMVRTAKSVAIENMVRNGRMTISLWAKHETDRHEQAYLGVSAIHGGPKHIGSHFYVKIWHDREIRALGAQKREEIWGIARTATKSFPLGKWFHLAVTVDQHNVQMFVDGKQISPPFVAPPSYIQPLNEACGLDDLKQPENCRIYVGGRAGEYGGFEGSIDALRVYNRVLDPKEIKLLANAGSADGKVANNAKPPESAREVNRVASPTTSHSTAITNVRLIDGNGREPVENSCVIVKGDRIVFAGKQSDAKIPADAQRIDGSGKSLLPGLIDSHFHSRDRPDTLVKYELENGITSLRDPGHPFKYYSWIKNSDAVIPRVFLCGGHLDAAPAAWPDQANVVGNEQESIAAVERNVRRGASAIKLYMRLPPKSIRAACKAAHSHGIPITAHLELVRSDVAIHAGIDGIEHITSFGTALAKPDQARAFEEVVTADGNARKEMRYRLWQQINLENNPRLQPLIDLIVQRGVFISPTLAIFESRPNHKNATPAKVDGFKNMLAFFTECHKAGARIVVGSHTSAPFASKGRAYLRELELMAEAGMTPLEIITAATKTNSQFFGVQDRLGTIEAGKQADLILIHGNPSADIRDIDRVTHVMLNGTLVKTQR